MLEFDILEDFENRLKTQTLQESLSSLEWNLRILFWPNKFYI